MNNIKTKKKINYFWVAILMKITIPIVYVLMKTKITPNQITLFNLFINIPMIVFFTFEKNFFAVAIMIQIYAIFDELDGMVARNKGLCSKIGAILDFCVDYIFYLGFYSYLGYSIEVNKKIIILYVFVQLIYGIVATNFIVPKMKKIENFENTKLKKYFRGKNIIFGMDVSLINLMMTISLIFKCTRYIFVVVPILWSIDLVYRLYEVTFYQKRRK